LSVWKLLERHVHGLRRVDSSPRVVRKPTWCLVSVRVLLLSFKRTLVLSFCERSIEDHLVCKQILVVYRTVKEVILATEYLISVSAFFLTE
jgi:hypothetical protein